MDADARRALAARVLERSTRGRDRSDRHERPPRAHALHPRIHPSERRHRERRDPRSRDRRRPDRRRFHQRGRRCGDRRGRRTRDRHRRASRRARPTRPCWQLGPSCARRPAAFAEATANATPDDRARVAAAIFAQAAANECWCSGYVTTATGGSTIATTAGADASFDGTECGANVKMTAGDSTGFAERYATDARVLDGDALGARAAQKARASADPVPVDPGEWTVILEPPAFGELVMFLGSHFSAQSVRRRLVVSQRPAGRARDGPRRDDSRRLRAPAAPGRAVRLGRHAEAAPRADRRRRRAGDRHRQRLGAQARPSQHRSRPARAQRARALSARSRRRSRHAVARRADREHQARPARSRGCGTCASSISARRSSPA